MDERISRVKDKKAYDENFDYIFGNKDKEVGESDE